MELINQNSEKLGKARFEGIFVNHLNRDCNDDKLHVDIIAVDNFTGYELKSNMPIRNLQNIRQLPFRGWI